MEEKTRMGKRMKRRAPKSEEQFYYEVATETDDAIDDALEVSQRSAAIDAPQEKKEAPKPIPGDEMIRWKKLGGGSFHLKRLEGAGKVATYIIKPNQIFLARDSEIPHGFRDVVVPLDRIPSDTAAAEGMTSATKWEKAPSRDEEDMYDIINAGTGKVLNSRPLTEEKADALLEDLT